MTTLVLDLPQALQSRLEREARKHGVSVSEYALETLNRVVSAPGEPEETEPGEYVLQLAARIRASIPEEERDKIPADLSINHDHYLYGTPKVKP